MQFYTIKYFFNHSDLVSICTIFILTVLSIFLVLLDEEVEEIEDALLLPPPPSLRQEHLLLPPSPRLVVPPQLQPHEEDLGNNNKRSKPSKPRWTQPTGKDDIFSAKDDEKRWLADLRRRNQHRKEASSHSAIRKEIRKQKTNISPSYSPHTDYYL